MIAKNYIKYPQALRFQCEMFSNGYHNSPRIMRLMECIFSFAPSVPDWYKEARNRAKELVKKWKKCQDVLAFAAKPVKAVAGFFGPNGETWTGRGLMPKWLAVRRDVFREDVNRWRRH